MTIKVADLTSHLLIQLTITFPPADRPFPVISFIYENEDSVFNNKSLIIMYILPPFHYTVWSPSHSHNVHLLFSAS